MENKHIGIIGIDCYEILLSLAILCVGLGEKVLIIDISIEEEFKYLVPTPLEMCMNRDKIHWLGIDFSSNVDDMKKENTKEYHRVFIYYGYYGRKHRNPQDISIEKKENCDEYILLISYKKTIIERLSCYHQLYEQMNYILLKHTDEKPISEPIINQLLGVKEWMKVFTIENCNSIHNLQTLYEGMAPKGKLILPTELKNYFMEQLKIWFHSLTDKQVKLLIDNLLIKRKGICYKGMLSTKERGGLL